MGKTWLGSTLSHKAGREFGLWWDGRALTAKESRDRQGKQQQNENKCNSLNLNHHSSPTQRIIIVPAPFQYQDNLTRRRMRLDRANLHPPSQGDWIRPQKKCPHPRTGVSFTDRFAFAVLPQSFPSPCRPTGCPNSPVKRAKKMRTCNAG